jgi:hypothetical protein
MISTESEKILFYLVTVFYVLLTDFDYICILKNANKEQLKGNKYVYF